MLIYFAHMAVDEESNARQFNNDFVLGRCTLSPLPVGALTATKSWRLCKEASGSKKMAPPITTSSRGWALAKMPLRTKHTHKTSPTCA